MIPKPTEAELEILQMIWECGPSTVRQSNDRLQKLREVGYTTTLKIMQIMFQKGLLSREKMGKLHIYQAEVSKETTQNQVIKKLADGFFHGSASSVEWGFTPPLPHAVFVISLRAKFATAPAVAFA